jgi:short-subunit dehydrogenase
MAVITGAGKGLGKAMAIALADAGARVALVARHREQLDETAGEIRANGGEAHAFTADITKEREVEQPSDEISARLGAIHILINNAGINIRKAH